MEELVRELESSDFIQSPELMVQYVKDPVAACAVLDAIALFELLGSKWMLAVKYNNWSEEIHEHMSDEVRHTKLVQDAAKEIRWQLSPDDLVREQVVSKVVYKSTEKFLNRLMHSMFKLVFKSKGKKDDIAMAGYTLLTFLIERRIMKLYPYFAKYAPMDSTRKMAKAIINDERKHLSFVTPKMPYGLELANVSVDDIIETESELANRWMKEVGDVLKH